MIVPLPVAKSPTDELVVNTLEPEADDLLLLFANDPAIVWWTSGAACELGLAEDSIDAGEVVVKLTIEPDGDEGDDDDEDAGAFVVQFCAKSKQVVG